MNQRYYICEIEVNGITPLATVLYPGNQSRSTARPRNMRFPDGTVLQELTSDYQMVLPQRDKRRAQVHSKRVPTNRG